jgi:hypothetical protein
MRNEMAFESFFELVPNDLNISEKGGPMMIPLDAYRSLQLMTSIRGFQPFK